MPIFNVPVTVQIEANSKEDAASAVLSYMEYAQDVGNDDGQVKAAYIGTASEITEIC